MVVMDKIDKLMAMRVGFTNVLRLNIDYGWIA
jgi:hypothetical protein